MQRVNVSQKSSGVGSSISRFTSINPFIVDINSFREIINSTLEVLQTNTARDPSSISWFVPANKELTITYHKDFYHKYYPAL